MPISVEVGPGRADRTGHEYNCIREPIVPHTVIPFKRILLEKAKVCLWYRSLSSVALLLVIGFT